MQRKKKREIRRRDKEFIPRYEFPKTLPDVQAKELELIKQKIIANPKEGPAPKVELMLLFGSYAKGKFRVEDGELEYYPPSETVPPKSTKSKSDFDLLIMIENAEDKSDIDDTISELRETLTTPIEAKILTFEVVKGLYIKNNPFILDVFHEGITLYDSQKFKLGPRHIFTPIERKELAEEEFSDYMKNAQEFYKYFKYGYDEKIFGKAAFNLHQVVETLLKLVPLIFNNRTKQIHALDDLRSNVINVAPEIAEFFPQKTKEQREDLKYLSDAYAGGRYMSEKLFPVSIEQLDRWNEQVLLLFTLVEKVCKERIDRGWED
jgi:HEPN domain-containing protein/predicted nucleotidyltransferase